MSAPKERSEQTPLVSVVIPCYNVAPYVQAAVESALDQTWARLEVIAVNDGATDQTLDILEQLAQRRQDERLRIISQPNGGLSAARNTGVLAARGRYIGFLDGDDVWLPEKIERQMQLMLSDPSIGLTFSFSRYLTEAGGDTGRVLSSSTPTPRLWDIVKRNEFGNGSTVIARRECFELAGLFDTELKSCEDYEMWCRILSKTAYRASAVSDALTCYRLRGSSLTFDSCRFTLNADLAMQRVRQRATGIPERVLRHGHAMHYRIAAWRALLANDANAARHLMARALRLWPPLILADWRAPVVVVLMLLPRHARDALGAAASGIRSGVRRLAEIFRPGFGHA